MRTSFGKFLIILWTAICLAGCSSAASQPTANGPTAAAGKGGSDVILVGTDATFPPFESLDVPHRAIIGFDVDLMNAVAAKAGLKVEMAGTRYGMLLEGIAQCQMTVGISAIPITDELSQEMLFSDPYFTNGQVVVVKKGNLTISGQDSLAGMTVGVQKGSASMEEVGQIAGVQLMTYPTAEEAFLELTEGLVDAVVADKLLALTYVAVKPNNLKIAGNEFAAESYGIAVCKQRPDLLAKINAGLAAVKKDGTLSELEKKWLK